MSYRFVDSFRGGPGPARKLSINLYDIYHRSVYSEYAPDDGQRNYPKHVEFHVQNKFVKLVHLVGFENFGGLGVACWPLVPKFAVSNPAEAVGFLRAKKSSARLPSERK